MQAEASWMGNVFLMVWEIKTGKWWLCIGNYWINNPDLLWNGPVIAHWAPLMKVFNVITSKLWNLSEMCMKYASAAVQTDSTNSDSCRCFLFLPPSILSGILSGCCFCIVSRQSGSKMPSHRLLRQRCQSSILGVWQSQSSAGSIR